MIFKYTNNQLQEQATMSEPIHPLFPRRETPEYKILIEQYNRLMVPYNAHIAALRVYQTEGSGWVEDKLYDEKEFTLVRGKQIDTTDQQQWQQMSREEKDAYFEKVAVLAGQETAQDDLWRELEVIVKRNIDESGFLSEDWRKHAANSFTITKKP